MKKSVLIILIGMGLSLASCKNEKSTPTTEATPTEQQEVTPTSTSTSEVPKVSKKAIIEEIDGQFYTKTFEVNEKGDTVVRISVTDTRPEREE